MTLNTIRKKLFNYLEHARDSKIKAIYTLVEDDIENAGSVYIEEFKNELNKRHDQYKNGKSKPITSSESKARISNLLASRQK